jgi:hypothetical protein
MKHLIIVSSVLAVALVGALATPAHADECNKLAYLTFSAPVELPGVTLSAGTYQFSHLECAMTAGLLQVSSADGTEVYGTFLTVPEQRMTPSTRPEVVFAEMPAGSPMAIEAWFYPGERTGDELIYHGTEAAHMPQAPTQKVFAGKGIA